MKNQTALTRISRWMTFSATALGSAVLLLATPQLEPDGVVEVSEFIQMEIYHDMMMKGSEVTVEIQDGIATLSGTDNLAGSGRARRRESTHQPGSPDRSEPNLGFPAG